jgi:haloalkane dehalogenase
MRRLSDDELARYRKPFLAPDARKPTLEWPRELPIEGEPSDVVEIVEHYGEGWPGHLFQSFSSTRSRAL